MVLTKSYLRYVNAGNFGVIGNAKANVCLVKSGINTQVTRRETYHAIVPALENVYIWDMRAGERVSLEHRDFD